MTIEITDGDTIELLHPGDVARMQAAGGGPGKIPMSALLKVREMLNTAPVLGTGRMVVDAESINEYCAVTGGFLTAEQKTAISSGRSGS